MVRILFGHLMFWLFPDIATQPSQVHYGTKRFCIHDLISNYQFTHLVFILVFVLFITIAFKEIFVNLIYAYQTAVQANFFHSTLTCVILIVNLMWSTVCSPSII